VAAGGCVASARGQLGIFLSMGLNSSAVRTRLRRTAIRAGLEAIGLAGPIWPQAAAGRGVIFTLHHVRPARAGFLDANAHLSITPQFLDDAISVCKASGFVPVALEDLPRLLAEPDDKRRFVSFTLDDGLRDNAEYAAPVFRKHAVPYTIFITEGFVERTRSLWWETAAALVRDTTTLRIESAGGTETLDLGTRAKKIAGFDRLTRIVQSMDEDSGVETLDGIASAHGINPLAITADLTMNAEELRRLAGDPLVRFGAHTLTHVNLRRVDDNRLRKEIAGSAAAVERYFGYRPQAFAYPYGFPTAVGGREIRAVADAGFRIAVTTQPGVLRLSDLNRPTAFHRVSLSGLYQKARYVRSLLTGIPFKLLRAPATDKDS
jgi:peptidoglycan/xylan/chitin deacetylase (PgdA/CDA1 family)